MGGIGPESTAEFYSKLIVKLQERKLIRNNQDYPQIIINSIPAPELIHNKISKKDLEPYIKGLKELDRLRVDFIVMVCNTIHLFYDELQRKIGTPIIDLRKEMKKKIFEKKVRTASVLATTNTIKKGLYKFNNIYYINPTEDELNRLSKSIFNFNKGIKKNEQIETARKVYMKYCKKVDTTILGCTEFAVMLSEEKNIINTLDVLVDATVERIIDYTLLMNPGLLL